MNIGFLGGGNMGGALMRGLIRAKSNGFCGIYAYDTKPDACARLNDMGINAVSSAEALFTRCDMVVFAVKPQVLEKAVKPYAHLLDGKFVVSIAAGWTLERLHGLLPKSTHVLRVMPNTPALVGCGMTAMCDVPELTPEERSAAQELFGAVGEYVWVDEHCMDAVTGVSGSGAAYVYMFIDAMACGGIRMGLTHDAALKLAAQTVKGAAQMVLDTDSHPDALRDAVCSPAGTTIEAVRVLEQRGLRSAVMDAVIACAEKSHDMSSGK